jgi:hypothetical protein
MSLNTEKPKVVKIGPASDPAVVVNRPAREPGEKFENRL